MSEMSKRLVRAVESAIDEHHRAHLGEGRSAAAAVLRELSLELGPYYGGSEFVYSLSSTLETLADEIEEES